MASPLSSTTLGKLLTHVPLSPSSIIWYQPMGDWEGNRRSGVALAMRQTIVVLPPTGSWP